MSPLNIVVGITGGIAAYKAVGVVRALVLAGHDVHVVPTEGALRFVGRPTLEAISRNPVFGFKLKGAKTGDKLSITWTDNKGDKRTDEVAVPTA